MKIFQILALILLTGWASRVDAQRIKGGAGFLKIGVANSPGAGTVLDQIAPTAMTTMIGYQTCRHMVIRVTTSC